MEGQARRARESDVEPQAGRRSTGLPGVLCPRGRPGDEVAAGLDAGRADRAERGAHQLAAASAREAKTTSNCMSTLSVFFGCLEVGDARLTVRLVVEGAMHCECTNWLGWAQTTSGP